MYVWRRKVIFNTQKYGPKTVPSRVRVRDEVKKKSFQKKKTVTLINVLMKRKLS